MKTIRIGLQFTVNEPCATDEAAAWRHNVYRTKVPLRIQPVENEQAFSTGCSIFDSGIYKHLAPTARTLNRRAGLGTFPGRANFLRRKLCLHEQQKVVAAAGL